jgi:CBS domain-containing protein
MSTANISEVRVAEVMRAGVHTCHMQGSLAHAAQLMWDHECGALPVLNDVGDAVAMITDRDICMAAYTQAKRLAEISIRSAASHRLVSVRPEDSLAHALRLMAANRVRRLPVIDSGENLIGILSLPDILRFQCATDAAAEMGDFEQIARHLATLSRPCRLA